VRAERADRTDRAPILAVIEQALALQLERLPPLPETTNPPAALTPALRDVSADRIDGCVTRAEEQCREVDALLGEAIAELTAWRERAAELSRRLAECSR
jgi:hypothetical protein